LRPDCPQALDRALLRTLHRDPDFRWGSARRLADELSWMQAHYGFGLMRRWKDELCTGKYVIPKPR
jgi:hypothetical protein